MDVGAMWAAVIAFVQGWWGLLLIASVVVNGWLTARWWGERQRRIEAEDRAWRAQEQLRREQADEFGRMQQALQKALWNSFEVGQFDDLADTIAERVAKRLEEGHDDE
jgi:hypothetical protein